MFRLKPGNYLFKGDDGYCYFVDDKENAARALVPDVLVDRFMNMDAAKEDDADYCSFIQILKERGLVEKVSLPSSPAKAGNAIVSIAGNGTVACSLRKLLRTAVPNIFVKECNIGDEPDDDTIIFVVISARQQDALFRRLDTFCTSRDIPWFRCCQEGEIISVSPLSIGAGHASYNDLRGRRLAASKIGKVLKNMWQVFDQQPTLDLNLPPSTTSLLVGYLSEIIGRFLNDDIKGIPVDEELCFNLNTLAVTRHPVLPLPGNTLEFKQIGED